MVSRCDTFHQASMSSSIIPSSSSSSSWHNAERLGFYVGSTHQTTEEWQDEGRNQKVLHQTSCILEVHILS